MYKLIFIVSLFVTRITAQSIYTDLLYSISSCRSGVKIGFDTGLTDISYAIKSNGVLINNGLQISIPYRHKSTSIGPYMYKPWFHNQIIGTKEYIDSDEFDFGLILKSRIELKPHIFLSISLEQTLYNNQKYHYLSVGIGILYSI